MSTIKELKLLFHEYEKIILGMIEITRMIPGSYKEVMRKCGKENCWCHDNPEGKGHILRRITWTENGKSRSLSIKEENVKGVRIITNSFKEFKVKKRALQEKESQIHKFVDEFEKEITKKTRQELGRVL